MEGLNFFKGKKVLVTGHTGFKGTWMSIWLNMLKAELIGYSLKDYPNHEFFDATDLCDRMVDVRGDLRDIKDLSSVFIEHQPEIVIHMGAQSLVRRSYDQPLETIQTNVMGTANVLECVKENDFVKHSLIVTSDKCYSNFGWERGYKEDDPMGGHDPYSASKGCAELLVDSYRNSFIKKQGKLIASARAGNVIGGGDYSEDRLIPDCIRALEKDEPIIIRNPRSTRPWQHVLEPVGGYLMLVAKMASENRYDEAWNFGPNDDANIPVEKVVEKIVEVWGSGTWVNQGNDDKKHEANLLKLDISKAETKLGFSPRLSFDQAIEWTVNWYKRSHDEDVTDLSIDQIRTFEGMR